MQTGRRVLLKAGLALATLAALPRTLLAAAWPEGAFKSTAAADAMKGLFGTDETTPSDQITLGVPTIAENGRVVPVEVSTSLENVESISIVVAENPRPLAVHFELTPEVAPELESRIKMGQTSDVMAVVKTDTGLYSVTKEVKVTIGGCGG
jgi:sulfur-oxidizing protein SoxY